MSSATLALLAGLPGRLFAKAVGYPRLIDGPMIGATTPDSFIIWSRASGAFDVAVEYATRRDFSDGKTTAVTAATQDNDLCTHIKVTGLKPDTEYYYRIKTDGIDDRHQPLPFRTRTAPDRPRAIHIAFGSCARIQLYPEQPVFDAVAAMEPDLFLWLGDNIYADSDSETAYSALYSRQRNVSNLVPLLRSVPQLAIWDDHDFGYNNSDRHSTSKEMTHRLFNRWWANPSAGLADTPGIFFRHSFGPVDIFMLDGRYHRDSPESPNGPAKTMLGAAQKAWLKRELKASKATFKILASGTGWTIAEQGGDSWASYVDERNEIFDFIRDNKISGCFGISGDVHQGEVNCVPWSEQGGYDFYDLASSGLAQNVTPRFIDQHPEVRLRQPWVRSHNFGLLEFSFDPEPSVALSIRGILGGSASDDPVVLRAADLVNGKQSWRAVIDKDELERREREERGGSYYGGK